MEKETFTKIYINTNLISWERPKKGVGEMLIDALSVKTSTSYPIFVSSHNYPESFFGITDSEAAQAACYGRRECQRPYREDQG